MPVCKVFFAGVLYQERLERIQICSIGTSVVNIASVVSLMVTMYATGYRRSAVKRSSYQCQLASKFYLRVCRIVRQCYIGSCIERGCRVVVIRRVSIVQASDNCFRSRAIPSWAFSVAVTGKISRQVVSLPTIGCVLSVVFFISTLFRSAVFLAHRKFYIVGSEIQYDFIVREVRS